MKIPYGISNFETIRREGYFYADKTRYITEIEARSRYVILLRPRRFGKSTFVSTLSRYYDVAQRDSFDDLFRGLWIHEHPTADRGAYLVLHLDFSGVVTDAGEAALRRTFVDSVKNRIARFLLTYRERVPLLAGIYESLDKFQDAESLLGRVIDVISVTPHRMYVIVDEYDHFTNRLLSSDQGSTYESIVRAGFVRSFFAALKAGTSTSVSRAFITGVSPIMLDDMGSGFNIADYASLAPRLNAALGFTREDVERAVGEFLAARPALKRSCEEARLIDVMEESYDGYRFSDGAEERVFNADMVLYFLKELESHGRPPMTMLDMNVRTEYAHLQRIGAESSDAAEERRALLQTIAGEGRVRSELVERFGAGSLPDERAFLSLLYYLGMLTFGPSPRTAMGYDLQIPNRVIRELQWEHLRIMLDQGGGVRINVRALEEALTEMTERGDIAPFLSLFHDQVLRAFSNRDSRGLDEKTIKLLFMTYASLGRAFYPLSEKEFAQGYGDLFLAASREVALAKYSWLLELKYVKAGAKPSRIEAAFAEAEAQVARYAADPSLLPLLLGDRSLKAGMLVFVGVKKVLFRPWKGV